MEVRIEKLLKNPYEISYGKTVAFDVFIMPSVRPCPEHVSLNIPGICCSFCSGSSKLTGRHVLMRAHRLPLQ